jgi:hypothetical protein
MRSNVTSFAQRCHWYRCACHSFVNDTAVPWAAESDFRIKTVLWSIREDIREILVAQRCQWHRCDMHNGVTDTAVQPTLSNIFANSKLYSIGFNLCIRGSVKVVLWWKNQRSKISCQGPFRLHSWQCDLEVLALVAQITIGFEVMSLVAQMEMEVDRWCP